mmetsp:Transcript_107294/g.181322  ORF Transcript_107294/g.181322 Transcript_107294/m.181322 type:complete len:344 (-) Transcript_107294:1321-2352(-)
MCTWGTTGRRHMRVGVGARVRGGVRVRAAPQSAQPELCCAVLCRVALRRVVLCCAVSCCVVFCCVVLCCLCLFCVHVTLLPYSYCPCMALGASLRASAPPPVHWCPPAVSPTQQGAIQDIGHRAVHHPHHRGCAMRVLGLDIPRLSGKAGRLGRHGQRRRSQVGGIGARSRHRALQERGMGLARAASVAVIPLLPRWEGPPFRRFGFGDPRNWWWVSRRQHRNRHHVGHMRRTLQPFLVGGSAASALPAPSTRDLVRRGGWPCIRLQPRCSPGGPAHLPPPCPPPRLRRTVPPPPPPPRPGGGGGGGHSAPEAGRGAGGRQMGGPPRGAPGLEPYARPPTPPD